MKKVILLLIIVTIFTVTAFTQQRYEPFRKNNISLCLMPFQSSQYFDLGAGIKYSRHVEGSLGVYASTVFVPVHRLDKGGYINNHIRSAAGIIAFLEKEYGSSIDVSVSAGLVHSNYGERYIPESLRWDHSMFNPISFELGVASKFQSHLTIGVRFDFVKVESSIDIGFSF